ncbi:unnamed protein product [Spirodela intermedia]|uniref:Uncharacterized protein n=1 Tax=Spirodela intermedia TaxID=51605 RepID=A0A7I8LCW5_SPIIN|nr:unnamed protein product [Spirodela intermedia]
MQSRRRSFADRFGPAGIGAAQPEYRKFGRGGGPRRRGPRNSPPPPTHLPPPPPPPPPPRRRTDVLREAGRLAAEYLAAKGLLPANPVPSSAAGVERLWPNGGDDEVDRASAFSRLGRRRLDGDDGGFRTKKRVRRRRHRSESYRRPGPEWGREDAGGPPWADRARDYSDAMDAEDLERSWRWSGSEWRFLDPVEEGESDRRSLSEESDRGNGSSATRKPPLKSAADYDQHPPSKDELTGESDSDERNHNSVDESGSKAMESSEGKAHPHPIPESEMNSSREPDEMEEAEKDKGNLENAIGGDTVREKGLQPEEEDEGITVQRYSGEKEIQLKSSRTSQLPSSEKMPAQTRSSEGKRSTETELKPDAGEMRENSDIAPGEKGLKNAAEEVPTLTPSNGAVSGQAPTSRGPTFEAPSLSSTGLASEVPRSQSAQPAEPAEQGSASGTGRSSYGRTLSFLENSFQQTGKESIQDPAGFDISTKSTEARTDEDSAETVQRAGMKQPQEWSLPSIPKTDEYLKRLDIPAEKYAVPKFDDDFEEQNHLPPSSFKICDLNDIEAPEITVENRLIKHESTSASAASLVRENDFSVGFGQKCDVSVSYGRRSNDSKAGRVIIDLEDDSVEECSAADASKSKSEPVCPNLENFMNQQGNPVDLHGIQNGYGLAISEFLGNDIQGCPTAQGDISNLGPFHDAEGISGNEDSLFVALGGIPINFMDVWDQPPSEYEKFF